MASSKLIELLLMAVAEMRRYGDAPIWSRYDSCEGLANFLETSSKRLAEGDDRNLKELWSIFAPTCDWDDAGGSQDLANEIFPILDSMKRPVN